jgi:hypothetical protein
MSKKPKLKPCPFCGRKAMNYIEDIAAARMELKRNGYREQPDIECCSTCKHSIDGFEGDMFCSLVEFRSEGPFIGILTICDKYERKDE